MNDELSKPFPESICHRCAAHRYVETRTSLFIMCTALPKKYPPQPVLKCAAFIDARGSQEDESGKR